MFQFLFKYPLPVFTQGHLVLLGAWPGWLLPLAILLAVAGLGYLIRSRVRRSAAKVHGWRAGLVWALQSSTLALLLILLWQPALTIGELSSHQNIIAVVIDDSRSMAIGDVEGHTREDAALAALNKGLLAGLQARFQTRLYRLDSELVRLDNLRSLAPSGSATHIDRGLQQLATETAGLPVGAVVLLSDGGQNSSDLGGSGINAETLASLHNRRIPVHTVGYGNERPLRDVEIEEVNVEPKAVTDSRVACVVSVTQFGYTGQAARLTVRDGEKLLAARDITLGPEGRIQPETLFFPAGTAGAKNLVFSIDPLPREENLANNAVTQPLLVTDAKRRILYIEGEPRWEYKFIRRAEDDDSSMQVVSMLRTSENKIYRQGISDPERTCRRVPNAARRSLRICGHPHRLSQRGLFHALAAGAFARVCRSSRRRRPLSRRPLFTQRWRLGRIKH